MGAYFWLDFWTSLCICMLCGWTWYRHTKKRREKRVLWRFVRYFGGGSLTAPHPMTAREAARWIGQECNAEVGHIDYEYGFIFYRPRGQ